MIAHRHRSSLFMIVLLLALFITLVGIITQAQGQLLPLPQGTDETLTEDVLLEKALEEAFNAGLKRDEVSLASLRSGTTTYKTVRMTLEEWFKTNDSVLLPGAAAVGMTADRPVYALVIEGDVEWIASPIDDPDVKSGKKQLSHQYIVAAIYADTGELITVAAHPTALTLPAQLK
jgi:hypothetical protein